ncbi:MAG: hypothetical protein HYZ93_01630 [Candidatus Omnitrophica bacterium]|nr:hypothetical protein [Candidatus Omnitrophota bacterium]
MTRPRIQQIVVVLLLITFVALWMTTQKGGRTESEPAPLPTASPDQASSGSLSTPAESPPDPVEETSSDVETTAGRDPFDLPSLLQETLHQREKSAAPPEEQPAPPQPGPVETPPPLELQGILWGTPRPQAIINRRIVSAGDVIGDATVLAVRPEGVKVSLNGREFELKLPQRRRPEE